jgi:hypothetical protein
MAGMPKSSHAIARRTIAVFLAGAFSLASPVRAAELKPETAAAYQRYVRLTQAQMDAELARREPYLWIEAQPEAQRAAYYAELRQGNVVIERLETLDNGRHIEVPGGLVHHWIGTVFIPGASLAQTLAFMEDYDHKADYFSPDVQRSKILRHEGDDFFVSLRFYFKRVITTVIDTDQEAHYQVVDKTHAWSRSHATRIQEVENAGRRDERLEAQGHDRGLLWGMNTYWRYEEKDGGTYMECQTVSLTRDIPTGLGWMIGPFVTNAPRESLTFTLTAARKAELQRIAARPAN